jgi:hypothetical protein
MPFVLLIIGELLVVTGIQGTQSEFYSLLEGDFTGNNSFIYWLVAIALIGALGYVPGLKSFSNAFLLLVLVVLVLHQNPSTLFSNLTGALKTSTQAPPTSNSTGNLIPTSGSSNAVSDTTTALNVASVLGFF